MESLRPDFGRADGPIQAQTLSRRCSGSVLNIGCGEGEGLQGGRFELSTYFVRLIFMHKANTYFVEVSY